VDGSGLTDAADVQCVALAALSAMDLAASLPACATGGWAALDVDCSTPALALANALAVNLGDLQWTVALALGDVASTSLDGDGDGCPNACEIPCGDALCSAKLGETCEGCPQDCGTCEDDCCAPHAPGGCNVAAVQSCVCALSSFCCDVAWDETCVSFALDACGLSCAPPPCKVDGQIGCGQSFSSSTAVGFAASGAHACPSALAKDGPERVWAFTPQQSGTVRLEIQEVGPAQLGLHVHTDGCGVDGTCVGAHTSFVQFSAEKGKTYYATVDGSAAAAGAFTLSATCASDCDKAALCADVECGAVQCNTFLVSCGGCGAGNVCEQGQCVPLVIDNCPGGASCIEANDDPGCQDAQCCTLVCQQDAFCCDIEWDEPCAKLAVAQCPKTCGDGVCDPAIAEDCNSCATDCGCVPGQGCAAGQCVPCTQAQFCQGVECGAVICGQNLVQCGVCANGGACADNKCFLEGTCAPAADLVCGQTVLGDNSVVASKIQKYACTTGFADAGDVAFRFLAVSDDVVEVRYAEGSSPFALLLLEGECAGAACTQISAGSAKFSVSAGETVYVMVDGVVAHEGPFALETTCASQCSKETACGAASCGIVQCGGSKVSCGACGAGEKCEAGECVATGVSLNCPAPGSCLAPHGAPGCDEAQCCTLVCDADSFCCEVEWDEFCVTAAEEQCLVP
jgi:hypothetical protein